MRLPLVCLLQLLFQRTFQSSLVLGIFLPLHLILKAFYIANTILGLQQDVLLECAPQAAPAIKTADVIMLLLLFSSHSSSIAHSIYKPQLIGHRRIGGGQLPSFTNKKQVTETAGTLNQNYLRQVVRQQQQLLQAVRLWDVSSPVVAQMAVAVAAAAAKEDAAAAAALAAVAVIPVVAASVVIAPQSLTYLPAEPQHHHTDTRRHAQRSMLDIQKSPACSRSILEALHNDHGTIFCSHRTAGSNTRQISTLAFHYVVPGS